MEETTGFIEKLKELVSAEDPLTVSTEVNELRTRFDDYLIEAERRMQVAQIEAREAGEEEPESADDFGKETFYEIYSEYKEKRKAASDAKKALEEKNLVEKIALTNRLRDIIQNEENIGAAFAGFKEVQENWKEIGDIPRAKRNEVQSEYSKLIEDFFYNIKIYKELKDHDFHRNMQLKEAVIKELKELAKTESLKEVEGQLKKLQNDWEDIGPVPNDQWERIKDAYWTEVRSVYERVNRYYEDKRAEEQANIDHKKAIIAKAEELHNDTNELDSVKAWEAKTKLLLQLQDDWKKIGFGPRKENEAVWKEFRAKCDAFFEKKRAFYDVVNSEFDVIADKKKELVDKALALKDSVDWTATANELIKLQKQWKDLGHSGKRNEQKLWKNFRSACDHYFNARQAHFAEKDKEFDGNLVEKQKIIDELKVYKAEGDKKEILATLKDFAQRFNALGMVPAKHKNKIYQDFKECLDQHYQSLDMDAKEKESTLFEAKIDTIKSSPDASKKFGEMKFLLRKDIDRLNKEINLLENNLGFFARSKGADALRLDVEKKIAAAQKQIDAIKLRLKQIPNE